MECGHLTQEVKDKMKETLLPYSKEITENNIISVFNSYQKNRFEKIKSAIDKLKQEEVTQ
jgi:hypothetical protein